MNKLGLILAERAKLLLLEGKESKTITELEARLGTRNQNFVSGVEKEDFDVVIKALHSLLGVKNMVSEKTTLKERSIIKVEQQQIEDYLYGNGIRMRSTSLHPQKEIKQKVPIAFDDLRVSQRKYDFRIALNQEVEVVTSVTYPEGKRQQNRTTFYTSDHCKIELSEVLVDQGRIYEIEVESDHYHDIQEQASSWIFWILKILNLTQKEEPKLLYVRTLSPTEKVTSDIDIVSVSRGGLSVPWANKK
jgi:hypothetical protein